MFFNNNSMNTIDFYSGQNKSIELALNTVGLNHIHYNNMTKQEFIIYYNEKKQYNNNINTVISLDLLYKYKLDKIDNNDNNKYNYNTTKNINATYSTQSIKNNNIVNSNTLPLQTSLNIKQNEQMDKQYIPQHIQQIPSPQPIQQYFHQKPVQQIPSPQPIQQYFHQQIHQQPVQQYVPQPVQQYVPQQYVPQPVQQYVPQHHINNMTTPYEKNNMFSLENTNTIQNQQIIYSNNSNNSNIDMNNTINNNINNKIGIKIPVEYDIHSIIENYSKNKNNYGNNINVSRTIF